MAGAQDAFLWCHRLDLLTLVITLPLMAVILEGGLHYHLH
jgi:hypothetical protein